jgi:hypothetical protein
LEQRRKPAVSLAGVRAAVFGSRTETVDIRKFVLNARRALKNNRLDEAVRVAESLLAITSNLGHLELVFKESSQLPALVELIWRERDRALRDLNSITFFLRMCLDCGQKERHFKEFHAWFFDKLPPITFSQFNYIRWVGIKDVDLLRELLLVKYFVRDDGPRMADSAYLKALRSRCIMSSDLSEFLFKKNPDRTRDFATWLNDLTHSHVLNHIISDGLLLPGVLKTEQPQDKALLEKFRKTAASLLGDIDWARAANVFEGVDTSRGLLLCGFHGAYYTLFPIICQRFFPNMYTMHAVAMLSMGSRAVGFRAIKSLLSGNVVFIAPDGPPRAERGSVEMQVFGSAMHIPEGAAVMAYETGSDTAFFSVNRERGKFVPVFISGPRKERGESFVDFRNKWVQFYSAQLEAAFSSDPANVSVGSLRWRDHLLRATRV